VLRRQSAGTTILAHATVPWIRYAGDEGGIASSNLGRAPRTWPFTSIRHLHFDRRSRRSYASSLLKNSFRCVLAYD
jgi:hypothetical protein